MFDCCTRQHTPRRGGTIVHRRGDQETNGPPRAIGMNFNGEALSGGESPYNIDKPGDFVVDTPNGGLRGVGVVFDSGEDGSGPDGDGLVVNRLIDGGAAISCGVIKKDDKLITIDGMDVRGITAEELEGVMLGPGGSRVKLGFESAKRAKEHNYYEISLVRR